MKRHIPQLIRRAGQKMFASFALMVTLVSGPLPALANAPVIQIESLPILRQDILDFIETGLNTAAQVGIKNASRAFLEKIAYEAAVTLTSGCEYQGPCINFKNVDVSVEEARGAAAGEFLNTVAQQNGFININLCDLPEHEQLQLTLLLPQITGTAPYQPSCTLSQIREEVGDYSNDLQLLAATLVEDPASLTNLSLGVMEGENALSSLLTLIDEQTRLEEEAEEAEVIENLKSDFTAIESPVSGYIKTPAAVLEFQTEQSYAQATQAELNYTGNPFADALSVFTTTLASRLLDQTSSGLLSFFTEADINDSLASNGSGSSAFRSSTRGNAQAARERFANLQTPSFTTGGQLDILNEFTNCPEVGVTSTNCVIGQDFRRAIEEKLTLRQAMDSQNGPLISRDTAFVVDSNGTPIEDYQNGLNKRSIAILQSHGVIPSTWMVAAEYNQQYDGSSLTLGQLMDAFNDTNSPYFGLVDPDWILKAPEVFCKVEGYGQSLALDDFVDTDGNPDTPEENIVSRLSSCVDEQTCLSEDNNGNCEAYGYCTKYEDRYRFSGEECPAYFASCSAYENSDGENFSVLSNTINSADCGEDSIGCQWLCGVYNDVNEAFQCASQNTVYTTCETDGGCACSAGDGSTCTVENGGFYCTTDSQEQCTLGTDAEEDAELDAAITFDDDAVECDDDENGCSEFIPVLGGANLVFNNSFESFNDARQPDDEDLATTAGATDTAADSPYDDTFGFYGADGSGGDTSLAGEPCSAATDPQTCYGWELDGVGARAVSDAISGSAAMQLEAGSGQAQMRLDTGHALENRTFTLNFSYMNPTSDACSGEYWVAPTGDGATYATEIDFGTDAGTFATEFADTLTFPDGISESVLEVGFAAPSGCDVVLDAVVVVEDAGSPGSLAYGDSSSLEYVNINNANQCSPDEVGCTEFTPKSGESDFVVTGQITNPLSEACGDGSDYSDPSCSQCVEEFVGCDAHIELPTPYNSPINDINNFSSTPDTDLAAAIAQRTGNYCDGTTTACNTDADCESGVQCLPSISIVPDQAQSCSAEAVGCEEYVNLDEVSQGGEGTEYYTFTQQCVKPTQDQIDDEEIDFYYSFESTESGYQLRSHYLKVSDDGSGAPCTNLDNYDVTGTAETPEADCVDSVVGSEECDPEDDAECIEYYDADLNTYYRLQSEVIEVSEECISARNSLDDRIYNILPSGSTECSAGENLCREYQGSEGGSAQAIIEEDFESQVWDGGTSSAESLSVDTGLSMLIDANTASVDVSDSVQQNQNYVIQFWAKGDGGQLNVRFTAGGTQIPFATDPIAITEDWQVYNVGPVVLENALQGNEALEFEYDAAELYVDNVVLSESESQYLLSDTLVTCNGYEGCEEYSDQNGEQHFLKSFDGLCEDDAVGCEALIDTAQDADNPFYTVHNSDNEFTQDNVSVGPHEVVTYTVTSDSLCEAEFAGCTQFGEPSLDAYENVTGSADYENKYLINDPDTYEESLCGEQQRWCDAWTEDDGESVVYVKNFGQRYCEYDSSSGEWVTSDGEACPLQNPDDTPSQPKGPVCNGGSRIDQLCNADSDCPAADGDTNIYRCVSTLSNEAGWAGLCSDAYNECTLYLDPNGDSEVPNDNLELDNYNNNDYSRIDQDDKPDYWNKLNEGESGSGGSSSTSAAAYTSSDVTNMTVSAAPDSSISVWHASDFATAFGATLPSGTVSTGSTSFTDQNGGNPASASATLVGVGRPQWSGMGESVDVTLETNNSTTPSVSFTFPALSEGVLTRQFLLFYLTQDGSLYWADREHDGVTAFRADFMSASEAISSEHLASAYTASSEPIEVNAYYDALGLTSEIRCRQEEWVPEPFSGEYSIEIGATNDVCLVGTDDALPVDENSVYTLSGKMNVSSSENTFGLGLLFYDELGNEINAGNDPTSYAIAAYEGPGRDDEESVDANTWLHFHGEIGPNLENEFPEGTASVRVFLDAGPTGNVLFDDINLNENEEYTYIKNSVDTTSCNGEQDPDNGCVAFRDTTNDSLTYLSDAPTLNESGTTYSIASCTFNSPVTNAACRARAFAADTNEVILVDQDRECSEWLACTNQEEVLNDAGEAVSVICTDVGLCTDRNPETGACTEWGGDKGASDLNDRDAVSTSLGIGNALALTDIQKMSSHATVGATWDTGVCTDSVCTSGAEGQSCSNDADCNPEVQGFYPYNWMPYLGLGGSLSTTPMIANGDFEDVFCDGSSSTSYGGYSASGVNRQRNEELRCTLDSHCRTLQTDQSIETYEATANTTESNIDEIGYEAGWCNNIGTDNTWSGGGNQWTADDADITIIDYATSERERIFDANTGVTYNPTDLAGGVGAANLDLDNHLYVEPTAGDTSFAQVELPSGDILDGQEYTVQFTAAHTAVPAAGDLLRVGFAHAGEIDDPRTTDVVEGVDIFVDENDGVQLTQELEQYTFGPIVANKASDQASTKLVIGLDETNEGTPFVLDDVQVTATLAVNGDGSEFTGDEQLIGRECRAYPSDDSLQCVYTDEVNDTFHQGWQGFCTVKDPFDSSKCITWFPVDTIPGERNFSSADLLFWSGHFPVYHCVAAKGNEKLGACSDSGIMCLEDSDCAGSSTCMAGNDADSITLNNRSNNAFNTGLQVESNAYETVISGTIEVDTDTHVGTGHSRNGERASFVRLDQDSVPLLNNIHISEIDNITFDLGDPSYSIADGSRPEPDEAYRVGDLVTFDLEQMELENADGYNMFDTGSVDVTVSEFYSRGSPEDLNYAWQRGVWCNEGETDASGLCDDETDVRNNIDDIGFYFVKGITAAGSPATLLTQPGGINNAGGPLNPFESFSPLRPTSGLWDDNANEDILEDTSVTNGSIVDGVQFDPDYFPSRFHDSSYSCMRRIAIGCGANIAAFYVDVDDGYIDGIYIMYWDGLHQVDVARMRDVSISIQLREVCLAAVETVDSDANVTPWWTRAQSGTDYQIEDIGYAYQISDSNQVYGRMENHPEEDGLEDSINETTREFVDITAVQESGGAEDNYNNLPFVYQNSTSMKPLACIGACGDLVCENDRALDYEQDSCDGNQWIGAGGICDDGSACNDSADCDGSCTFPLSNGDGVGSDTGEYLDQLNEAVNEGWNRLNLVFADLPNRTIWYAGADVTGNRHEGFLTENSSSIRDFCDTFDCDAFERRGSFDFDAMLECPGLPGDGDYCGERPVVESIRLNNSTGGTLELDDGESVNIRFETDTNDDQEPVQTVMIDWEADESGGFNDSGEVIPYVRETGDGTVSYSHVYTCDGTRGDEVLPPDDEYNYPHCLYRVRVQIRDNWEFCSGEEGASSSSSTRGDNCTSYDEYAGDIVVRP